MLAASGAVTVLALSKRRVAFVLAVVVLSTLLLPKHSESIPCAFRIKNDCVVLEVVRSQADRERGLSGRTDMLPDTGMLFMFDTSERHCFWMKGMRFSLDILWLDESGSVVFMQQSVQPNTYPRSFCPDKPARFVVELYAGTAASAGLGLGSRMTVWSD